MDQFLGTGFRLFTPGMSGPAAIVKRTAAALDAGCDGINDYHYGHVPEARLGWVGEASANACDALP